MVVVFDLLIYIAYVDIILFVLDLFSIILANFLRMVTFLLRVKKCTNFTLVASGAITINSLILVRVVKAFHCSVTLIAKKSLRALLPARIASLVLTLHVLAVFGHILENFRWSPKVSHMMRIDATFGIVGIFLVWAPT